MSSLSGQYKYLLEIVPKKIYILRGDLIQSYVNLGTHMMFFRLHNDKYMVVDTIDIDVRTREGSEKKSEVDLLTDSGRNIDYVIAAHSYHTLFFTQFYNFYKVTNPSIKYYGTPRHKRMVGKEIIPWESETIIDLAKQNKFVETDSLEITIPDGDDFAFPSNDNHVLGAFFYHMESQTLYIDDTLVVINSEMTKGFVMKTLIFFKMIKKDRINFHPNTLSLANFPAFRSWLQDYCSERRICNLLTAHIGNKIDKNGLNEEILRNLESLNRKYLQKLEIETEKKSKI